MRTQSRHRCPVRAPSTLLLLCSCISFLQVASQAERIWVGGGARCSVCPRGLGPVSWPSVFGDRVAGLGTACHSLVHLGASEWSILGTGGLGRGQAGTCTCRTVTAHSQLPRGLPKSLTRGLFWGFHGR